MQNDSNLPNEGEFIYLDLPIDRYCIKTGKRLEDISYKEVKDLISIHGKERAKIVLIELKKSIANEWILTDSEGLSNLALHQPVEYLIYALSAILTKPNPENILEVLSDFDNKISINKFLHTLPTEQIINIAELIRRILASNRPIAIQEMLNNINMVNICETSNSLFKFQITLQRCLEQITFGYYDHKLVNERKRQRKVLFDKQKRLTALTELEREIEMSLNNFDLIFDDSNLIKSIKTTKRYKNKIKSENKKLSKYFKKQDKTTININEFRNKPFSNLKFKKDIKS